MFFQRVFFLIRRKSWANSSHRSAFLPHRASSSDDPASCRSKSDNPNSGPECASWNRTARTCRSFGRHAPTLYHFGHVPTQELPDQEKPPPQNFNATLISPTSRGGIQLESSVTSPFTHWKRTKFPTCGSKWKSTSTSGRCEDKTAPFWSGPLSSLMNNWEGSRCDAWGRDVTRLCAQ